MIWNLLLPESKKVVTATTHRIEVQTEQPDHMCQKQKKHGKCGHKPKAVVTHRLTFNPYQSYGVPILLHICQETRYHLLPRGNLISFPNQFAADLPQQRALWWNFKDTLVFDSSWHKERLRDELLTAVTGLEHVRHIALTKDQAHSLGYSQIHHCRDTKAIFASLEPNADAAALARPLPRAIRLRFEGSKIDGVDRIHFVPRFFTGLHTIMVAFPQHCFPLARNHNSPPPLHPTQCPNHSRKWVRFPGGEPTREQVERACERGTVTFHVHQLEDMRTVMAKLKKLRELWAPVAMPGLGRGVGFDHERDFVRGPVLAVEEGHRVQDKYRGGEFKECRALPIVVMGIREPNFKRNRELL